MILLGSARGLSRILSRRMLKIPRSELFDKLKKNWFLVALVLVISLAYTEPWVGAKGGPLLPEYTVKYGAVFMIFFNSGLSIKTEEFSNALFQVRVHVFIQLFTLAFVPLFVNTLVSLLRKIHIEEQLLTGLLVVSCMPPPVSSAVILTKAAEGNEAVAIFNSAFGSFLGIVVTPMLLLLLVGTSSAVPLDKIVYQLSSTVVLPLIWGNTLRNYLKSSLEKRNIPYSTIGNLFLLLIIYSTFCDTFQSSDFQISSASLFQLIFIVVCLQLILLALSFYLSSHQSFGKVLGYSEKDTVAIMFCATHKSLTLGIPMLKIVFHGDLSLPVLSIPLLIYHPTQILLGGVIAPSVRTWVYRQKSQDDSESASVA